MKRFADAALAGLLSGALAVGFVLVRAGPSAFSLSVEAPEPAFHDNVVYVGGPFAAKVVGDQLCVVETGWCMTPPPGWHLVEDAK